MRSRPFRTLAAVGAASLALAACSGGGGGDGGGGGAPDEVVAGALGDRLDNGAAFTLSAEGDLDALAEQAGEPAPPEVQALFDDGLVSGAFAPEGGFALTLGSGDGFFEFRAIEETLYLRIDLQALAEFSPEASAGLPDPEQLQAQLGQLPLPPDVAPLAQAALAGEWVGITGLSAEAIQSLAEDFGAAVPPEEELTEQQDQIRSALEEQGLTDGQAFTDQYLTVEGEGPAYDVTVDARALAEAFTTISSELQDTLGGAVPMSPQTELPDPGDVPEQLSGFTVTVEDGTATRIAVDAAEVAQSAGEDSGDLEPGDLAFLLELDDVGGQLDAPGDAQTIAFDTLVQSLTGAMFSGGLGG